MTEAPDATLRAGGYRITAQRQLVLQAVVDLRHATPEQILSHVHRQAPGVNLSTVYRVLTVLEEVGLVRHAHIGTGSPTYHATEEDPHIHLVCRDCAGVQSVPISMAAALIADIDQATGFAADIGHAAIHGRCAQCRSGSGSDTESHV
jgi:Fur family ferric uptake transcriptional regulator